MNAVIVVTVAIILSFIVSVQNLVLPKWEPPSTNFTFLNEPKLGGPKCFPLKTLDISKLSGVWFAVYIRFNGFRCFILQMDYHKKTHSLSVDVWNSGKKTDNYTLIQEYPKVQGFLERNVKQCDGLKSYPWYVVDTDYDNYLAVYHVINSKRKHDLWAIYSKQQDPDDRTPPKIKESVIEAAINKLKLIGAKPDSKNNIIYPVMNANCSQPEKAPGGFLDLAANLPLVGSAGGSSTDYEG